MTNTNTEHIPTTRFDQIADGATPTPEEQEHLKICSECGLIYDIIVRNSTETVKGAKQETYRKEL